jgi:gliding motility-associated-like protein
MSVIELNDYDIGVSQIGVNEVCYGVQDTVSITLTNQADSAIDFTVDTVLLNLNLAVNGSLVNSYTYELNNNSLLGIPLQPDSSISIEITGVDFSITDSLYTLSVISSMKRDINALNDTLKTTQIPRMAVGTISPLPKEVCFGSSINLKVSNTIGAGNWQFSDDGSIFQNYQPNDSIIQQIYHPTYFRYQVCNVLYSDTVLVGLNRPPIASDTNFNSCDNYWELIPRKELMNQTFVWFYENDTVNYFYKGDTLTVTDTLNPFFYIKSMVDSCYSTDYAIVQLLWENCKTPDTTQKIKFLIPNVITPNGDGINDYFVYTIDSNQALETTIFDRWGREVANWNGNIPWFAEKVEAGTYFIISKVNGTIFKSTLNVFK